jgi:hypothetical protein
MNLIYIFHNGKKPKHSRYFDQTSLQKNIFSGRKIPRIGFWSILPFANTMNIKAIFLKNFPK